MTKGIEEILGIYRLAYGLPDPRNGAAEFCKAALMYPVPPELTPEDADAVQDLLALLDPQGTGPAQEVAESAAKPSTITVDVDVRGLDTALKKMERLKRLAEDYADAMKRVLKVTRAAEENTARWVAACKDVEAAAKTERRRQRKEGRRRQ